MPTEKTITDAIIKRLRNQPGVWVRKNHGERFGAGGIPDIEAIWQGRAIFFEVKQPGKKATALQQKVIRDLHRANAHAYVVTSADNAMELFWEFRRWSIEQGLVKLPVEV